MARIDASNMELQERVVTINRVSKTVKGGRIFKFAALVVVGDGNGTVGFGLGKASEVPDAIRKGIEDAKKNLVKVSLKGTTIPHEVVGVYGAGRVLMRPAPEGTGLIAGGPVRAVLEVTGVKNIRTKSLRSRNPKNMVSATMQGLMSLRNVDEIAAKRGKSVREIICYVPGQPGRWECSWPAIPMGNYCPVIGWCPPRENCPAGPSGRNRPGVCGQKE